LTFVLYLMYRVIMEVLSEKNRFSLLKTKTSIGSVKGS
jgi:hypothetical protein